MDDMTLARAFEPITHDADGSEIIGPFGGTTTAVTYPEVTHPGTGCRRHQVWDFDCQTCLMVMTRRIKATTEREHRQTEQLMGARA
jgi:hypothetical protein